MRYEGLDQTDLRAIIIVGRRLDLDVDIDATDHGELVALVRGPEATFCLSRNSGTYQMTNSDKGHVVAESDSIGEILTALSQPAIARTLLMRAAFWSLNRPATTGPV